MEVSGRKKMSSPTMYVSRIAIVGPLDKLTDWPPQAVLFSCLISSGYFATLPPSLSGSGTTDATRTETRGQWPYRLRSTRVINSSGLRGSADSKQPQRSNLTSDLKPTTLITRGSVCILPQTAILVASEAMYGSLGGHF